MAVQGVAQHCWIPETTPSTLVEDRFIEVYRGWYMILPTRILLKSVWQCTVESVTLFDDKSETRLNSDCEVQHGEAG
jgi:hypothetical protein